MRNLLKLLPLTFLLLIIACDTVSLPLLNTKEPPKKVQPTPSAAPTIAPTATSAPQPAPTNTAIPIPTVIVPASLTGKQAGTGDTTAQPGKPNNTSTITALSDSNTEAGLACFGTPGDGLLCLSAAGEWKTFTPGNSHLGSSYITTVVPCFDNNLLISHSSGLSLFDGEQFLSYDANWGSGSVDDIACDADGGIWVAHFRGVSYFDGSSWTAFDSDTFFAGDQLVNAIEIAPDGGVWVLTTNHISRFNGHQWALFGEKDFGHLYYMDNLSITPDNVLWISTGKGLIFYAGQQWEVATSPDYLSPRALQIDAADNKWLATLSKGIKLFDGGAWQTIDSSNSDLASDTINALIIDNNERIWVGTNYGLTVRVDEQWITYRMDNTDMTSNDITAIGILNGGPALPESHPKETGSLSGTVVTKYSRALADSAVAICIDAALMIFEDAIPCEGAPLVFQSITSAEGAFTFDDIPVGLYSIAFETAKGWKVLSGNFTVFDDIIPIVEGEHTDLGTVQLTK